MARASERMCVVLAALLGFPATSIAAPGDTDKATAQQLFVEGRALMEQGEFEQACRDFAESQRLDPAIGTRFNLADCYEQLGKLASAWVHYVGVADAAQRAGQLDRAGFAREKADALEARLSRLRIEVPDEVPGLIITRAGTEVGPAQWSRDVPVDRGAYEIEASAPEHEPWSKTVEITQDGVTQTVTVPALVPLAVEVPPVEPPPPAVIEPAPSTPDKPRRLTGRHIAGIVVGSLGIVGLSAGGAFGVLALRRKDDAERRCPDPDACFADGAELRDEARRHGTTSTALFIVGGVLLASGIVLVATGHLGSRKRRASVEVAPTIGGLALRGRW